MIFDNGTILLEGKIINDSIYNITEPFILLYSSIFTQLSHEKWKLIN